MQVKRGMHMDGAVLPGFACLCLLVQPQQGVVNRTIASPGAFVVRGSAPLASVGRAAGEAVGVLAGAATPQDIKKVAF